MRSNNNIEKYSSAFTLSDMEIFIYPELFYSLLLANIMSPILWKWKDDPWFKNIEKKSFNYKMNRIKQYIIEHYVFNLDLETWGLTDKKTELNRFSEFVDTSVLKQSNALFGYEGDKYYFSIDIRKHFGLDKYNDDTIPYWKTETIEAMDAFRFKENYPACAGECVSLSSLYAAAMFVVGKIPLEKIFLLATPLHSQNFIAEKDGVITNNRRIVTKNMWFNGTLLSAKARRAIENEKITIVSHITGHIHTLYNEASIDPEYYNQFEESLKKFLKAEFTPLTFINFLRTKRDSWKCFQYTFVRNNREQYIDLEVIFKYEHTSKNSFAGDSRTALLNEIDPEEFSFSTKGNKISLNEMEEFLSNNPNLNFEEKEKYIFDNMYPHRCSNLRLLFLEFKEFLEINPRLPEKNKDFIKTERLKISTDHSRQEIIDHILEMADKNDIAHYAQYTFRMMDKIDWLPFIKAAIERNPVSISELDGKSPDEIYQLLNSFDNISIYEGKRLALPDEVWNYKRGEGIEKAFIMANFLNNYHVNDPYEININNGEADLTYDGKSYIFKSDKGLIKRIKSKNRELSIS